MKSLLVYYVAVCAFTAVLNWIIASYAESSWFFQQSVSMVVNVPFALWVTRKDWLLSREDS